MDPQAQNPPQVSNESQAPAVDVVSQVVSTIQNSKNVLVTVAASPSVDELASALGLTFLLGKLGKHATAVFSGKIPSAMEFLDPENTFESTVDSLRDFIIALDKEKADKLRYKVEDEVVKIFITPYRTILSEKDLEFSQGDFNVDAVVALGVEKREELDKAITSHGRILHDASVITINAGNKTSSLGSVDWNDPEASSAAEMLVALSDAFGGNLLDNQISTALLTGIVAETNRFSNEKTSPKVMSLSAQLMAAGANQQLIATNLRQEGMISEPVRKKTENQPHDDDGEMVLDHGKEAPSREESLESPEDTEDKKNTKKTRTKKPPVVLEAAKTEEPKKEDPATDLKETLAKASEPSAVAASPQPVSDEDSQNEANAASTSDTNDVSSDSDPASATVPPELPATPKQPKVVAPLQQDAEPADVPEPPSITPAPTHTLPDKPIFGGTLNATTAGAEEDRDEQEAREAQVNNVALSHDDGMQDETGALDEARKAVDDANVTQPFNPANQPLASINSQPLPSIEPAQAPDTTVSAMQGDNPLPMPAPTVAEPDESPVDAFMQPHTDSGSTNPSLNSLPPTTPPSLPASQPSDNSGLPPLPPLPGTPAGDGSLPPLPPLPGQPASTLPADQASQTQPQINPPFVQDMPQSQNPWTQASDDLAAQQANNDTARQEKADKLASQYDAAVDRNREIQGLPPVNDPNGSGLPPLPPLNP